jgi:hypothetical protein
MRDGAGLDAEVWVRLDSSGSSMEEYVQLLREAIGGKIF